MQVAYKVRNAVNPKLYLDRATSPPQWSEEGRPMTASQARGALGELSRLRVKFDRLGVKYDKDAYRGELVRFMLVETREER